jgi:hypothetical protein
VLKNAADHGRVLDRRQEPHLPPAAGTRHDIGFERDAHAIDAFAPGVRPRA